MSTIGEQFRFSRLFAGGKVVIVAVDHGLYNGPLAGMTNLSQVVPTLEKADAILTSPGMIQHCGEIFKKRVAPSLVIRLNWGTQYANQWNYTTAQSVRVITAQKALALGADFALVGFSLNTGSEELDAHNVEVLSAYVAEKQEIGIPLIGEFFPAGAEDSAPEDLQNLVAVGCRVASELGVDAIKTFFTGERFSQIVAATPVPIFTLGAKKTPREVDALRLAEQAVQAGAAGVVFGRNVIQAKDPGLFLDALKAVVKDGKTGSSIAQEYGLN